MITTADWRTVFYLTGIFGVVVGVVVVLVHYSPDRHPRLATEERELLADVIAAGRTAERRRDGGRCCRCVRRGLVTAKFLSDAAWYFYLFWLPKYPRRARLRHQGGRGVRLDPYAAAGSAASPAVAVQPPAGRERAPQSRAQDRLGLSAAVMPAVLLIPSAVGWALAIFSLAYFGQQSWSTLVMILPTDMYPRSAIGAVAGLVGFGGAMGGVVFGQVVGTLLDRGFGYGIVFTLAGSFHVLAFIILCVTIPIIAPVMLPSASRSTSPIPAAQ